VYINFNVHKHETTTTTKGIVTFKATKFYVYKQIEIRLEEIRRNKFNKNEIQSGRGLRPILPKLILCAKLKEE
jgi:hypothetical protein